MVYQAFRHKVYIGLLILLITITLVSRNGLFKFWLVPTISIGFLYLADIIFSGKNQFEYEPDYYNWKAKCDPEED